MEANLLPFSEFLAGRQLVFQQYNTQIHKACITKHWFNSQQVKVLNWLSGSPDLNIIENVWHVMTRNVYENNRQYISHDELKASVENAW